MPTLLELIQGIDVTHVRELTELIQEKKNQSMEGDKIFEDYLKLFEKRLQDVLNSNPRASDQTAKHLKTYEKKLEAVRQFRQLYIGIAKG